MNLAMKENFAVSSLILVEGDSDKLFIEALIKYIQKDTEVDSPVCSADECELMEGKDDLKKKLEAIKRDARKHGINKVGIVLDANSVGVVQRDKEIQEKILQVFGKNPDINFSSYIVNVGGKGELETLLKAVKSNDSSYADCLNAFQDCLPLERKLSQKEFDKLWVYNYQKEDCDAEELDQMYNFNDKILDDLKEFLNKL